MLRHLLLLLWRRKARHLLLTLEISLAFTVVFAVSALGIYHWRLYQAPLGFEFDHVWQVQLQPPEIKEVAADPALLHQFRRHVQALPAVQQAATVTYTPYANAANRTNFSRLDGSGELSSHVLSVSDGFFATLQLRLLEGRWFTEADAGTAVTPVAVNRRVAEALFPGQSAVGQTFAQGSARDRDRPQYRVTAVFEDYRDDGEFMTPPFMILTRFDARVGGPLPLQLALQVRPGTPRVFEAELLTALRQIRPGWTYQITPLADLRTDSLRMTRMPLAVLAVVAAFLLLMVGFGLFGVLWQATTRRIPEIGLRRAVGATGAQIYGQILAEQALLSSGAIALALALLVQLPLTGALQPGLTWPVFGWAAALSAAVIVGLSLACALYPGWLASRLKPAQALHHE